MTNQPTVSSWSCLSTLIYLLISTVSEQKPGNNISEGDPASRRDWHLAGKRVRNALCTSSTHPSLCTSTWPSIRAGGGCCKQKKVVRRMCSLLLCFSRRFSTAGWWQGTLVSTPNARENSKFHFAQGDQFCQRHPVCHTPKVGTKQLTQWSNLAGNHDQGW